MRILIGFIVKVVSDCISNSYVFLEKWALCKNLLSTKRANDKGLLIY